MKSIRKQLITLAIPVVLEQILSTLLQYVDTAMVGRLGQYATASVSVTTTITWLVNSVPYAIATATLTLVAQAIGAKELSQAKRIGIQAIYLSFLFAAVMEVLSISLSPWIPIWMGAEDIVCHQASVYFAIISIPLVFRVVSSTMAACIRATGDTKTPMIISVLTNVLNITLNAVFIYGLKLGVTGAALSTAVSYTLSFFAMLVVFNKNEIMHWSFREFSLDKEIQKKVLSLGFPVMMTNFTSCAGYVVFAGLVSSMGTTIFAAHSIAVTAEQLFYIQGYGLRTATSTMVGYAVGENDEDKLKKVSRSSILMTMGMMVVSGAVLYLVAYPLMCVFTPVDEVAILGADMLRIVSFSEPFFGLMIVLEGIYYGLAKTKEAFVIETASMWGIRIVFTFLVVKVWHLGLAEVWYCMIADNICKAVLFALMRKRVMSVQYRA